MRHILSSFLALHWAVVFALLAFICIDGNRGLAAALGVLGVAVQSSRFAGLENPVVVAPLAVALLVVAALFCWAFVEALFSDPTNPDATDSVVRVAFICASGVLSLIVVGGAAQGINGLLMVVAVQLAALLASYVAMLAERRSALAAAVPGTGETSAAAHLMAKAAAPALSRISGRLDTNWPDTNLRDR
ncbi:hypothetical protein [Mesorhizobium ventifaucium]|uniref:Transmembrane protein n=1 Tax=Mesorhizobium ventifaucium TaxID=666020 RepID=A0ABN8JVY1_9HYPH|nr:hypothetical protein [Mesorhizobium ventifaucium]CAH2401656.1 conserved membrane hypothetical protein [Mesorhizobium ventifaucium]